MNHYVLIHVYKLTSFLCISITYCDLTALLVLVLRLCDSFGNGVTILGYGVTFLSDKTIQQVYSK